MAEIHRLPTSTVGDPNADRLWRIADLAKFLGYAETTLARLVSSEPDKLPPRVAALGRARWDPATVRAWVTQQSGLKRRPGRPRLNRAS